MRFVLVWAECTWDIFLANDKQLIKSKLSSNVTLLLLSLVTVRVPALFSGSLFSRVPVTTSRSLAGTGARLTSVGWQGAGHCLPSPSPYWPTTKVVPASTVILDRGSLSESLLLIHQLWSSVSEFWVSGCHKLTNLEYFAIHSFCARGKKSSLNCQCSLQSYSFCKLVTGLIQFSWSESVHTHPHTYIFIFLLVLKFFECPIFQVIFLVASS